LSRTRQPRAAGHGTGSPATAGSGPQLADRCREWPRYRRRGPAPGDGDVRQQDQVMVAENGRPGRGGQGHRGPGRRGPDGRHDHPCHTRTVSMWSAREW